MARDSDLNLPDLRARAVQAARGKALFDLLIRNTRLLDMVTGQTRDADIGIVGGLIASVHAPDPTRDAETQIDADGQHAIPGLIDTHMHVESSMVTPAEYAAAMVPRGVTTIVWDPHEFANVSGLAGVDYAIDASRDLPLRVLTLAPTCVPSAPGYESAGGDFTPEILKGLLARDEIHGAAELMTMQPLLDGNSRVTGITNAALASGKRICGHARGLEGGDLAAYAAAGVETDHELTSAADLIARLEMGMIVELRGSHAHLLPEFAEALCKLDHFPATLTFCTDDVFPDDLYRAGGLDHMLRRMIAHGLPAPWAYRAATFNAAQNLSRKDLGLIAPGRRADILLLDDLEQVRTTTTLIDGRLVAQDGKLTDPAPTHPPPPEMRASIHVRELTAADFEIPCDTPEARIATLSKPRFPEWGEATLPSQNGKLTLPENMIRMAVINRHGAATPPRIAILENWGSWRGAFATTISHDSHNLTLFGRDPEDMALAANALRTAGGGLCVVANGQVQAQLALPLAGLVSEAPLSDIARDFEKIRRALDKLVDWQPPYLVFKALFGASLVCNAGPRLSDMGLVDVFNSHLQEDVFYRERP